MSEERREYWEQQFRASEEQAALLAEASVRELIEIHHASGDDFDLGSMAFTALQRRPHAEILAEALVERRARTVKRKRFAATLISLATETATEREANLPLLMAMLRDRSPRTIAAAIEAIGSIQSGASSSNREFGMRLRTTPEEFPAQGWPPIPAVVDLNELAPFASHPSYWVGSALAYGLWLCGDPQALELLLKLTRHTDQLVRGSAAGCLALRRVIGGSMDGVIERLQEMSFTDDSDARFAALASLVELGDVEARTRVEPTLTAALNSGLHQKSVHSLLYLLWKDPDLVSLPLRQRLADKWHIKFDAVVPSQIAQDAEA